MASATLETEISIGRKKGEKQKLAMSLLRVMVDQVDIEVMPEK